jgi:hypothetical protein
VIAAVHSLSWYMTVSGFAPVALVQLSVSTASRQRWAAGQFVGIGGFGNACI